MGKTPIPRTVIDQNQPRAQDVTVDLTPPLPKSTPAARRISEDYLRGVNESSPLLGDVEAPGRFYTSSGQPNGESFPQKQKFSMKRLKSCVEFDAKKLLATSVRSLPAVLLGVLLNILDGISYGLIIFPTSGIFADLGGIGVSMFFVSAVIAQLVYSAGGSGFAGANGSMMIEVVPFFHILATTLAREIGEDKPHEVIATTLAAFAFSSILTGLTFFILGALKLGALIGFFPRHILIGCIGGVGVFLITTGFTVSTRMEDEDFALTWDMFKFLVLDLHNLALWLPSFVLAALLRVITHKFPINSFSLLILLLYLLYSILLSLSESSTLAISEKAGGFSQPAIPTIPGISSTPCLT